MSDNLQSQLHVTCWPGVPVPLPDTRRVESRLNLEEGVIVPSPRGRYGRDWEEEPVSLDGETYLRLAVVDLDDPEAIFAFVSRYGPLGGWQAYNTVMKRAAFAPANLYRGSLDPVIEDGKKTRALEEHARKSSPGHPAARSPLNFPSYVLRFHFTETLDEFRF